jgi:trigger factor
MKVQVEELSPIEKKLSIEVEASVVANELKTAYQTLSRQVKIAGFRPGHIPRHILEQRFKSEVEEDVSRRVMVKAYLDAIKKHDVEAVGDPHLQNGKLSTQEPYAFTARVEVKPRVQAKDYQGLKLTRREVEIGAAEVDDRIATLRERQADLAVVEARPLKKGDYAVIDFTATVEGKDFPGGKAEGVTVEVAEGALIEGNVPEIEGVSPGGQKEFDYTFPAEYRVEEVKGKVARFNVTVKEVKERKLPELNDPFVAALGMGVHTVDELKAKVKKDMERAKKSKASFDDREEIFKALIEKNPFDLPRSMLERGVDMLFEGAMRSIMRAGVDPRQMGIDVPQIRNEMRPKAEVEVRGQLILEAIGRQEKVEVSDAEFEKKLEELAEETGSPLSKVRKELKTQEAREGLEHRIREEKTLALVKSQAQYS